MGKEARGARGAERVTMVGGRVGVVVDLNAHCLETGEYLLLW